MLVKTMRLYGLGQSIESNNVVCIKAKKTIKVTLWFYFFEIDLQYI